MFLVTQYQTTREYGGPEEGGWWYDWSENPVLVATHTCEEGAYVHCRALNRLARANADHGGQGRYSVLGGADPTYTVERVFGEDTSTVRPHYE